MQLIRFIRSGAPRDSLKMVALAAVAGLMGALLLEVIDDVATTLSIANQASPYHIVFYLLCVGVLYLASKRSLSLANEVIEKLLDDLRLRLVEKVRRCELRIIEELGRTELTNRLSQEIGHLSQMFPLIITGCQNVVLVVFCALYIATVSLLAFLFIVASVLIAVKVHEDYRLAGAGSFQRISRLQESLLESFGHMVDGCKEIRMHEERNDDLYQSFCSQAEELRVLARTTGESQVFLMVFGNLTMYSVLAAIVFVFSQYLTGFGDEVFKLATAFLFCFGPLTSVVGILPILQRAEGGLRNVLELERHLDAHLADKTLTRATNPTRFHDFQRIQARGIRFDYETPEGRTTFSVGPLDLNIERGKLVFIVGGNGAGKSTVLKLLTGLYPLAGGVLEVDGLAVESAADRAELRELFAAVFVDFHLFDRLYGFEDTDPAVVNALIERVELQDKVSFEDGGFSDQKLSTGQKKRLALVAALLEDREVYVFDEWTADQDVHFREHFYSSILPDLKRRGKTVVAVTHDGRYLHLADHLVKMELGEKVALDQAR